MSSRRLRSTEVIKPRSIRRDAARSKPTLCLKGCHTVQSFVQVPGEEWACPACDARYPFKYWKIQKRNRRTDAAG